MILLNPVSNFLVINSRGLRRTIDEEAAEIVIDHLSGVPVALRDCIRVCLCPDVIRGPAAALVCIDRRHTDKLHDRGIRVPQAVQVPVFDPGPAARLRDTLPDPGG